MEHLEILVEEASMEEALKHLIPAICGAKPEFRIHPHQGRPDLLAKLPGRLRAYRQWLPDDYGIVVLIDEDREDCMALKARLNSIATEAGFVCRDAKQPDRRFQVLNRIAVEELEAWYFGDVRAMVDAYPGVPETLGRRARFRNPDAIAGGTWEALERTLRAAGHHLGGLQKIKAARDIAPRMDPRRNTSQSFQAFRDGLLALARASPV